jgi:hypothetical protein
MHKAIFSTKTMNEISNHMSQCKARTQCSPSLNKMNSSAVKSTKWKWGETPWHKGKQTTITHKLKGLLLENRGSNTKELECHATLQSKKSSHVSTNFLPLNEKTPTKNLSWQSTWWNIHTWAREQTFYGHYSGSSLRQCRQVLSLYWGRKLS